MASSSNSSNPIAIPSLPNASNFLTIKLDRTNYPLWHVQMLPLLRSRNLVSFVDGTNKCPLAFLKDDEGKIIDEVNPKFDAWIQQDAMVLSWINSLVHPTVLAFLIDEAITYSALEALLLGAERRQKLHTMFENEPTALVAGRGRLGPYHGRGVPNGGRGHFNGGRGQFVPRPQG
ncbi:unnamed protein product [Malus baccata var. baccata]